MTKKIISFLIAIFIIFATSSVFAANEIKDTMEKAGNGVQNVVDGAGNIINDAGTAINNGAKSVGNAVSNGTNMLATDMTRADNTNSNYSATRTSTDSTIMGMSANMWTWFVLAILALAIIALVWYYAMQNNNTYDDRGE
jgi:sensor c-di-GMP phosphodiesterase-like protein